MYESVCHAPQVGFQLVDAIARAEGISVDRLQDSAAVGRGRLAGQRILLAKPMTFMNNSGDSVRKLVNFYKVSEGKVKVDFKSISGSNCRSRTHSES